MFAGMQVVNHVDGQHVWPGWLIFSKWPVVHHVDVQLVDASAAHVRG